MFDTVIFDLDGTLLDTLRDLADAANHALQSAGLPTHPVAAFRQFVGSGANRLIERMLPPSLCKDEALKLSLLADFNRYYALHKEDHTHPYPGICPLLATLRREGIKTGVVSNKPAAFVPQITGRYFPELIGVSIGLAEGAPPKPHPAGLQQAMKLLSAVPARTLYVGDSNVDVATAHRIPALLCCGVLWGFRGKAELEHAGADFLAADAAGLQRLIFTP